MRLNILKKSLGVLLRIAGYLLGVAAFIFTIALFKAPYAISQLTERFDISYGSTYAIVGIIIIVAGIVGTACYWYGKTLKIVSADEERISDKRPPVIYLRSFEFDDSTSERINLPDLRISTEEEVLAKILRRVGPCVAVGKPGDIMPRIGFSRKYVSDEHWQQEVQKLMSQAALIIVCAGNTPGLQWELMEAKNYLRSGRLVLLITRFTNSAWYEKAEEIFSCKLPEINRHTDQGWNFDGFIYFDPHGIPQDCMLHPFNKGALKGAIEEALTPVFAQLNIRQQSSFMKWASRLNILQRLAIAFITFWFILILRECVQ